MVDFTTLSGKPPILSLRGKGGREGEWEIEREGGSKEGGRHGGKEGGLQQDHHC